MWLEALLCDVPFKLQHTVFASQPVVPLAKMRVEFDASPWGGGALLYVDGEVSEFAILRWTEEDCTHDQVSIGSASHQTYWEFATSWPQWWPLSYCTILLAVVPAFLLFDFCNPSAPFLGTKNRRSWGGVLKKGDPY